MPPHIPCVSHSACVDPVAHFLGKTKILLLLIVKLIVLYFSLIE